MPTTRIMRRVRMIPGRIAANNTISAGTNGTTGINVGTVDTAGADLLFISINRNASTANVTKNIWRFASGSAAANTWAQNTEVTTMRGSSILSSLGATAGSYGYWVDLRGSVFGRYWTCKLCAVTGSTRTDVTCDLYRRETYPNATALADGFVTITEVVGN